ncbi:transposase [Verrucomicrobia bacterium S94]|nr:transposase [Verrucomicrobia bacterium S94]QBG46701.1 transposase [Verrucomicrobia bacterium S94]QBG47699.1 transposase [Verrucomicrobia bacterium S94]QBG48680.1 transposase [Verrucomicrobia bacterium S94]
MLSLTGSLRVFLAVEPVDLRKSFNGLHTVVLEQLKEDPCSGALFVFTNRRRTLIKSLYWDGTGMWVMIKRLEQGRFTWPKGVTGDDKKLELAPESLSLLLDGVDLRRGSLKPWYQR